MVEKLQGMFAIAICDVRKQKIYLCRDRLGKKPLFYFQSDNLFAFASEIKSLLKHPVIARDLRVNRNMIGTFLHLGYFPEPHTIYASIKKFPAAAMGEVGNDLRLDLTSYWTIRDIVKKPRLNDTEKSEKQFRLLLDDAVQKRLISDVPLGGFLSGGTDSSLISAIAAKHSLKPFKTFSIGFKDQKFDESHFAGEVARCLKTDHTAYVLEEKEAVDLLDTYLHHFDEPFADTSAIPTMLVSKLARQEVKVALTGDGGDELFQGYGAYAWANRLESTFWKTFRKPLRAGMTLSGKSRLMRIAKLLDSVGSPSLRSHIFSQEQYLFSQHEIQYELFKNASEFVPFDYDDSYLSTSMLSEGEKQAVFDIQYYLKDDLLVKVDRASMFYALECRSPLLDEGVVECALSLNYSLKVRNGTAKWLLKKLLKEYLPDHLVDRPKWGFGVPLMSWLKGDLRYLVEDNLNDDVINSIGLFNPSYTQQLKRDFFGGKDYLYNRLWAIIVVHRWFKENQSPTHPKY